MSAVAQDLADIRSASPYRLRLAEPSDIDTLYALRQEAADWIWQAYGVRQWPNNYPTGTLETLITNNETYMVDRNTEPVATITIGHQPDTRKWNRSCLLDSAVYVSKLMVARCCTGEELGQELLDFADGMGYENGVTWTRLDAWTANTALHSYYESCGFELLDIIESGEFASGALFQRQIPAFPYIGTQLSGVEQFITRDY